MRVQWNILLDTDHAVRPTKQGDAFSRKIIARWEKNPVIGLTVGRVFVVNHCRYVLRMDLPPRRHLVQVKTERRRHDVGRG